MSEGRHAGLEAVRVAFGERTVFDDLSLSFPPGRITMLMGPSGSGKSTILRLLGGLTPATSGRVFVNQEEVGGSQPKSLVRARSHLGMLFQSGALLDSMTVFDNVALPLREHTKLSPGDIRETVTKRLLAVGLPEVEGLLPGELSGGMLRRAALARAIVTNPAILLCDEPFSGLDPPNVQRIESLLHSMCRERGLTLIIATHKLDSALRIADGLVLLLEGAPISGTPSELSKSSDLLIKSFLRPDELGGGSVPGETL